jgi:hypothetical protein
MAFYDGDIGGAKGDPRPATNSTFRVLAVAKPSKTK